jgi:glyoxylase-like metal-dependent hydrolase (beta-lactamase superfamily II)
MQRRNPGFRILLTVFFTVLAAVPAVAQVNPDEVEIKTHEVVAGQIYMLEGQGGNLGVSIGEDGVFLIDDQFAPLTEKIRAAIAKLSAKPIRFVLNTHWHGDHTGGNENLGKAGTLIVAHDNVRVRMSSEQFIATFNSKSPPAPKDALPVVTFNDAVTFHQNGDEIHAFHVPPAHTDGDSIVHFRKANVLHLGDIFFNTFYPFIDTGAGGSIDGMIAAVERILPRLDETTKLIPGHGPVGDKAALITYLEMLRGVRAAVAPLVAAGKSVEEVVAMKPTAAFDEAWGQGFLNGEVFTKIVYEGMRGGD